MFPPTINDVAEAAAWTFNMSKDEYLKLAAES